MVYLYVLRMEFGTFPVFLNGHVVSAVILSPVVIGHGSIHSCRHTGVALLARETGVLAADRLLGGVFERHDFASPLTRRYSMPRSPLIRLQEPQSN